MTIDGRLLLAVAAALSIVFGFIVLALERRLRQPIPGLRLWAVASFLIGVGAAFHVHHGSAPLWLPALVGNALLLAGRAFTITALYQFDRRRVPARFLAALCATLVAGVVAALFVWPSQAARSLLMVGGLSVFALWAAAALSIGSPLSVSRTVTITGFAGVALANASRLWGHARQLDAGVPVDLDSPTIAVYIGVLVICDVLCNVGFVLLITDRMHDWVLQLVRTDHLTGALSRGALYAQAQRDLQLARRQRTYTAAFIVDIDHFKTINDSHGHAAGDAVLRHVARHGQAVLRCTDLFGRYGGDEFVAVLPETDLLTAAAIAERLRVAVGEPGLDTPGGLPKVTVSIGVAAVAAGCDGLDALIAQADDALYNAKNAGRNRTRVADDAAAPAKTSLRVLQGRP
ncbi:MAG: diguanylate cyclase [Betaproteobacteria bacterium]